MLKNALAISIGFQISKYCYCLYAENTKLNAKHEVLVEKISQLTRNASTLNAKNVELVEKNSQLNRNIETVSGGVITVIGAIVSGTAYAIYQFVNK